MNPNQELWEGGDFTRIAASMRDSGDALVEPLGITKKLKVLDLGAGRAPRVGRDFYGPSMNAYTAAAESGRGDELHRELSELVEAQNTTGRPDTTAIPATYLRVTVQA